LVNPLRRKINKGCGKTFLRAPDPLTCGKKIKTSDGKKIWYCEKCMEVKNEN